MSRTIPEILTSGEQVEIDLLLAVPSSTDQTAFVKPAWRGYQSAFAVPLSRIRDLPVGMEFSIQCQFLPSEGIWQISAVAVSYQGGLLFVAPMNQDAIATPQTPFPVKVVGLINAVV